ncbi:hypothetical protein AeRB84_013124 [Aphanomyces euteiches]|nr:hypothetical protein AeRB84_013124 [Aphanomyces euteiches]
MVNSHRSDNRDAAIVVVDVTRAYSNVPTPHEVDLSNQLLALQADRDVIEKRFEERILDLERQLREAAQREEEILAREQKIHLEQVQAQNDAILAERALWAAKLEEVSAQLALEMHNKETEKKWHDRFHQYACSPSIHPLADEVFARFGQTIALLPSSEAPHVVRAGVLDFLANVLRETTTDAVLGPVLIGLRHLSLYQGASPLRSEIVKAGALPPLVRICEVMTNPAILAEAARLMASLASCPLNKTAMAAKHAVRAMAHILTTYETQSEKYASAIEAALQAMANLVHGSDTLRNQAANSGVVPCITRLLSDVDMIQVRLAAATALANIGFAGLSNQTAVVMAQGDMELTTQLGRAKNNHNYVSAAALLQWCALGLGNLAATSVTQISIGYTDAIPLMLQLLVDASNPELLEACGLAIGSLCYQCKVNKVRVASQNGIQVLLYVLSTPQRYGAHSRVLSAACLALATVISTDGNLRLLEDLDGHIPVLDLCMTSEDPQVLLASSMAVAAQIPTLEYKFRTMRQGKPFKVQEAGGIAALERVALVTQIKPSWLQQRLDILGMSIQAMSKTMEAVVVVDETNPKSDEQESVWNEVMARQQLIVEALVEIHPDELCTRFHE